METGSRRLPALLDPSSVLLYTQQLFGAPLPPRDSLLLLLQICDELLPNLRARSHLHNLIHRDKTAAHCLLQRDGHVVAGATVRLFGDLSSTTAVCVDVRSPALISCTEQCGKQVLLMACTQKVGCAGLGLGTAVANQVKSMAATLAADSGSCVLTQSDEGVQATCFWKRQVSAAL